jgi:hypothetical protein
VNAREISLTLMKGLILINGGPCYIKGLDAWMEEETWGDSTESSVSGLLSETSSECRNEGRFKPVITV